MRVHLAKSVDFFIKGGKSAGNSKCPLMPLQENLIPSTGICPRADFSGAMPSRSNRGVRVPSFGALQSRSSPGGRRAGGRRVQGALPGWGSWPGRDQSAGAPGARRALAPQRRSPAPAERETPLSRPRVGLYVEWETFMANPGV